MLCGEQTLLVSIYGLNRDNGLVPFYNTVLQTIIEKGFDSIENIISRGDFNCPLAPLLTKEVEIFFPRRSVIVAIEQIQSKLDVHDIWAEKSNDA